MDPLPLLRDLVATNSVNPSLVPGAPGEAAAAEVARVAMIEAGMDVVVQEAAPGRPNVIGVLEGRLPGPSVMFCGHLDTVGVDGMHAPFDPRIAHGRLYGRGSQDMKAGVAAMIAAAGQLAASWTAGRLIVAAVADEEHESLGALALVRDWRADVGIVTEPTGLAMATAHKGFAWLDIETRGRAAHGSRPDEGRDAICRMGRVLVELEARGRALRAGPPVGLQGTGSLHASLVTGGRELSSYPDRCQLQMERRTVTGESNDVVLGEVQAILARLTRADPEFEAEARLVLARPAYEVPANHRLCTTLGAAIARTGRAGTPVGATFWTDAAILGEAGITTVLFGPGGAGLHSVEEYVLLDDVYICRDVLVDVASTLTRSAEG
jgi:acetylornithine deacetylase